MDVHTQLTESEDVFDSGIHNTIIFGIHKYIYSKHKSIFTLLKYVNLLFQQRERATGSRNEKQKGCISYHPHLFLVARRQCPQGWWVSGQIWLALFLRKGLLWGRSLWWSCRQLLGSRCPFHCLSEPCHPSLEEMWKLMEWQNREREK